MRVRRYEELSEREKGTIYIAAWLLHYYGYGYRRIKRILLLLYGVDVSKGTICSWLYEGRKPKFPLSTFEKALFYHVAYELALKLKREHPDWGHKRIASELSKLLPVYIPPSTVYFWITGRSRPNVTPINLRELGAIAYCVGVLVGDYCRACGGLRNRDETFVRYYAEMYAKATGVRLEVNPTEDEYYMTCENGGWLRALWKTGLWKVFAYLAPREFLKGLYDSEGNPSPNLVHRRRILKSIQIFLTIGDPEVKRVAKMLLERMGFKVYERYREGEVEEIDGRMARFSGRWALRINGWDQAEMFAKLIGFRVSYRREVLKDLLRLRPLSQRQRYHWWTTHYEKTPSGKWRKKH